MALESRRLVVMLASVALAVLLASGAALALPSQTPDNTPMVNGPVRAIDQVGTNVWVGGNFSEVRRRDGSLVDGVGGLAVFDSAPATTSTWRPAWAATSWTLPSTVTTW